MTSPKKKPGGKAFTYSGAFTLSGTQSHRPSPRRTRTATVPSPRSKKIETDKNTIDPVTFGLFWDRVEGVPSWLSLDRIGQSPTGYPDDRREPPKETNMVEQYKKEPHVDTETKEVWRMFIGFGGLMLGVVCIIIASMLWRQVPPQVQALITWVPYGLMAGSRMVWSVTAEFILAVFVVLKRRAFKDALVGGFKRL